MDVQEPLDNETLLDDTTEEQESGQDECEIDFTVSTWNVRSLPRARRMRTLAFLMAEAKSDVTALQEIQWKGSGIVEKPKYHLFYSCYPDKCELGVGFLVMEKFRKSILRFKAISPRLAYLRFKSKYYNISLINAHAPTEDRSDQERDEFYVDLGKAFDLAPEKDIKVVVGDFDAVIGKERKFLPNIGLHSLHEYTSDNGHKLIEFARSKNLIIGGTYYPHKKIHKGTYIHIDNTVYQTDHILIEGKHKLKLLDVRAYRGTIGNTDHFLLKGKLRPKLMYIDY